MSGIAALVALAAVAAGQQPLVLGTIAGDPWWPGLADGLGRSARFQNPAGMEIVGDVLYVADAGNHAIRAVDLATAEVTTVAGTGTPGFDDGPVATATLNTPLDVAYDADLNALMVADAGNHAIRMVDLSAGEVSTLAGTGTAGYLDGPGPVAQFREPAGVCIATVPMGMPGQPQTGAEDAGEAGDAKTDETMQYERALLIADTGNHCIRGMYEVSNNGFGGDAPSGLAPGTWFTYTVAGTGGNAGFADGAGYMAQFNRPVGLLNVGGTGVLIADSGNHAIRLFSLSPLGISTVQGDGTPGEEDSLDGGTLARFRVPLGLGGGGGGGVLIGDSGNHRIRAIDPLSAATQTIVGSSQGYRDAVLAAALLSQPWDTASSSAGGGSGDFAAGAPSTFVSDSANHCIRALGTNTPPTADAGGPYVVGPGDWLQLDGSGSSDADVLLGDGIVSWGWDFNDDDVFDAVDATVLMNPVWVWLAFGDPTGTATYPYDRLVTLEVQDVFGATDSADVNVRVLADLAPQLTPTLSPEPPWTQGTTNELEWTDVGAMYYELEWAAVADFSTVLGSLQTPELKATVTGLVHNTTYYYRVRGMFGAAGPTKGGDEPRKGYTAGPWSGVESSTQDAVPPNSTFGAPADPLKTRTVRTRLPWASVESGSGFTYMRLWYSYEDGPLTRYPGRWSATATTPLGGNDELAEGDLVFDASRASGDGWYKLFLSGLDAVGNEEPLTGRDLKLIVDATPPAITDIRVFNITLDSADISWRTSEPATCRLDFGETTAYGQTLLTPAGKRHQVHLAGLTPDTDYHFEIAATDDFGNQAKSGDQVFRTRGPKRPVISNIQVSHITHSSADISWDTDTPTTGVVEYGLTSTYIAQEVSPTPATSHRVHLSGLIFDTVHHFRITATNAQGGTAQSADRTFRTLPLPPFIFNIQVVNITQHSADILWDTDRPSSGVVDYGLTTAYGAQESSAALSRSHRVHLTGLDWGTVYHFRITATDALGQSRRSADKAFRTLEPPPLVILNIEVANITRHSADVSWETNRPTIGLVEYGETRAYGELTPSPVLSRQHRVHLGGLKWATLYHFRVLAFDTYFFVARSPDQTFRTRPGRPTAPRLAPEPEFTRGTENRLSWSSAEWATTYRLEVALDPAFPSVTTVETADLSATVTGLTDGATYYYRVAGVNSAGVRGGYSNVEHSTQDASPPETHCELLPTLLAAGTSIELGLHASDASSGVKYLLLYFAKDRGPFRQFGGRLRPATTTVHFDLEGQGGGHYAFYTIGVDNVGNREAAPDAPDVEVDAQIPTALTYLGDEGTTTGAEAVLAANLLDAFGAPVKGADITYALGGLTGTLPPTDAQGFSQQVVSVPLPPGLYDLVLTYAGDAVRQGSSVTVAFVVKPVVAPPEPGLDVTGRGTVVGPSGETFAFDLHVSNSPLGGSVTLTVGTKVVRSTSITGVSMSGGVAVITGLATVDGSAGHRFVVRVTDGSPDRFGVTATDGTFVAPTDLASGGVTVVSTP